MKPIFDQGKQGSLVNRGVDKLSQVKGLKSLNPNPETDIGKRASDFIGNKLPYTIKTLNPFTMLKKNIDTDELLYEVNVYIGGEEGDKI